MAPPKSFADDFDCGNFFDQIDDLLDFPDDVCNNNNSDLLPGDFMDFPNIWTQPDSFLGSESVFSGDIGNSKSGISAEVSFPYEDLIPMDWRSAFVEDSFSAGNSLTVDVVNSVPNNVVSTNQFQTSSPVSVLESSSSCYARGKVLPVKSSSVVAPKSARCGRARSKRPRPPTFNPRASMQLISPCASFTQATQPFGGAKAGYESFADSHPSKVRKLAPSTEHKKKKKVKLPAPPNVDQNENLNPLSPEIEVRKCQHCEITKTPQWRAGPMGPKTLCNACGVRYKSGRLFPEYRPAASPTFVPTIHSNSHKKVLEMRVKTCDRKATTRPLMEDSSSDSTLIGLIPNNNNSLVDYV